MKIAIVGDAHTTRGEAPFDDPSWEIWGLHTGWHLRRATRMFDLHDAAIFEGMRKMYEWPAIAEMWRDVPRRFPDVKMYRHPKSHDLWPGAETFPFEEILAYWQARGIPRARSILTSTVAWMIAFALTLDPEEIGIWGVDMDGHSEYGIQRTGGEMWVGVCYGRGVQVTLPESSLLCATPFLYGLEMERNAEAVRRIDTHERALRYELEDAKTEQEIANVRVMQMHARAAELEVFRDCIPPDEYAKRATYLAEEAARWSRSRDEAAEHIRQVTVRLDEPSWERTNWTIADPPPTIPDSPAAVP